MYVRMQACMYVYTHVCMCVMHACMYVCMYVCNVMSCNIMYVCMCACMYVCMYVCAYVAIAAVERVQFSQAFISQRFCMFNV